MGDQRRSVPPGRGGFAPVGGLVELRSALVHPGASDALVRAFGDPPPVVVVFADLVGFTALSEAQGDGAAVRLLDEFFAAMRELAERFGMTEVKTLGDGFLLTAKDPVSALGFAAAALRETSARDGWLDLRLGLHAGPVVERDGDVFGRTVNVAARVAAAAEAGEALISMDVLAGARAPQGTLLKRVGRRRLRDVSAPVELFSLSPRVSVATVTDPVCRRKLRPAGAPAVTVGRRTFYFCSEECRGAFERSPRRYAPRTCMFAARAKKRWRPLRGMTGETGRA
ncbi:MAG: adenylate/guanylate cyclase domain-containing protein [Actinomycetota bacterium]